MMSGSPADLVRSGQIRRPKKKKTKSRFIMRPLKYLALQVVKRRNEKPFPSHIVTKALIADAQYVFERGWNMTVGVEGETGEGKSEVMRSLALMLWLPKTEGKLHTFYDIEDIPPANDGDWIHLDEWIISEGAGKIQSINRLKNIANVSARAKQISVSVSTVALPEVFFLRIFLTTIAQDFNRRENLVEVRIPLARYGLVYIGNAIIPLDKDEEKRAEYEKETYERKTNLFENKGLKTVEAGVDWLFAAKEVIRYAKENQMVIRRLGEAKSILGVLAKIKEWPINYNDEAKIAALVTAMIEKPDSEGISLRKTEYVGQTEDLQEAILKQLILMGFKPQTVLWFKKYALHDVDQRTLGKQQKPVMSQSAISQAIRPIRVNGIGYAFEEVFYAVTQEQGLNSVLDGGNGHAPDLMIFHPDFDTKPLKDKIKINEAGDWWLDDNLIDKILGVRSLKCYVDKANTTTIPRSELANSELSLFDMGIPLTLFYYDFCTGKLYEIPVSNQEKFTINKKV